MLKHAATNSINQQHVTNTSLPQSANHRGINYVSVFGLVRESSAEFVHQRAHITLTSQKRIDAGPEVRQLLCTIKNCSIFCKPAPNMA